MERWNRSYLLNVIKGEFFIRIHFCCCLIVVEFYLLELMVSVSSPVKSINKYTGC